MCFFLQHSTTCGSQCFLEEQNRENEYSSQRGRISFVYKHSPGRLAMVSTGGEVESVVPTLSMRLDASAVPAGTEEGLEGF